MHAGRLHAALEQIKREYAAQKIDALLTKIKSALDQSIKQPTPEASQSFKEAYAELESELQKAATNEAPPSRRAIFDEIGASPKMGIGLLSRIREIFNSNSVTPAVALTEIQTVETEVKAFRSEVGTAVKSCEALKIEYTELGEEEVEIGVSLPRELVKDNLHGLEKEIHSIERAFKPFQELVGEGAESPVISTISTSDLQIFLESTPTVMAAVVFSLNKLADLYKKYLDIKKVQLEVKKMEAPEPVNKSLDGWITSTVKSEIQKIVEELISVYLADGKDKARKNELKVALQFSLEYMANRIDHGGSFEARMGEPKEPEVAAAEEGEPNEAQKEQRLNYEKELQRIRDLNDKGSSIVKLEPRNEPILLIHVVDEPGADGTSNGDDKDQKGKDAKKKG